MPDAGPDATAGATMPTVPGVPCRPAAVDSRPQACAFAQPPKLRVSHRAASVSAHIGRGERARHDAGAVEDLRDGVTLTGSQAVAPPSQPLRCHTVAHLILSPLHRRRAAHPRPEPSSAARLRKLRRRHFS